MNEHRYGDPRFDKVMGEQRRSAGLTGENELLLSDFLIENGGVPAWASGRIYDLFKTLNIDYKTKPLAPDELAEKINQLGEKVTAERLGGKIIKINFEISNNGEITVKSAEGPVSSFYRVVGQKSKKINGNGNGKKNGN